MIVGRHRRVDWVLFVALLAGACGGSKKIDPGEACTLNSDCRNPLSCSFGKCHETCVTTRDCPLGSSCVMTSTGGVCQLVEEADCRSSGACAAGMFCAVDYRCRTACQSGAECTSGQVCVGGVCAELGDLDTTGSLPVKNPSPSVPGQGGGPDAGAGMSGQDGSCVMGPSGYCWSLWKSKTASSPASKVAWVTPPTVSSAHFTATAGIDSSAGAAVALHQGNAAVDLGAFDQIWIDAEVPVGQAFRVSIGAESTGNEPGAYCAWTLTGRGTARYVVDLGAAHDCWPTASGFNRSTATLVSLNPNGWGTENTLDINVTGIGFSNTTGVHSSITTSGEPGQGLNGWCTSLVTWGNASASWLAPPTAIAAQAQVTNLGGGGTGGALFELFPAQRNLSGVTAIEFDADVQLGANDEFTVQVSDMNGANCQYNKIAAVGPQTYVASLATPTICQTSEGRSYDRTKAHSIKIGSHWPDVGPSTFKITRLALKSGSVVGPVVTPDAGVAGPVDARPPTTGADAAYTTLGTVSFSYGSAQGLFNGWGWVSLGDKDTLTSPGCDSGKPISNGVPCTTSTTWNKTNALCMSGTIPALPASPVQADYDSNWGMRIGVNAAKPSDAIGDALAGAKAVTFTFSGLPTTGLRAMFHRKGDPDGLAYCVDNIKSGVAISLSKFNTKCWSEDTTVFMTTDDLPKIDNMGLQVSSNFTEITVQNLCLEKVEFAK